MEKTGIEQPGSHHILSVRATIEPLLGLEHVWDNRIGRQPRLRITTRDELMHVPSGIVKTVVFLAVRTKSGLHFGGTAFALRETIAQTPKEVYYLVTASHVIDAIRDRTIDNKVYIRANPASGDAVTVESEIQHWVYHQDQRIDAAATPLVPVGGFDQTAFGRESLVTDEIISREKIGVGIDLVFPGLFVRHFGTARNIPIVRTGVLAAMPDEPVEIKRGAGKSYSMPAYLAEARSIGGLSGSPVFCVVGPINVDFDSPKISYGDLTYYLLGLVHGHYDLRESNWDEADIDSPGFGRSVNMGIAILVRAKDILALLDHPVFVEYRGRAKQSYIDQQKENLPRG